MKTELKPNLMPNRKTHDAVGAGSGAAIALCLARDQDLIGVVFETLGGALAGKYASRLPDVFDRPVSPNHRSLGHGVLLNGYALASSVENLSEWQDSLRRHAGKFARLQTESNTASEANWYLVLEILSRMASGAIAGALAGYASHLILDSRTKKGLPLIA